MQQISSSKYHSEGSPHPLGVTYDAEATNCAIYAPQAKQVELCLFDFEHVQRNKIRLMHQTNGVWHSKITGLKVGDYYGYRISGLPENGNRFNPSKLLLDPYAKKISHSPKLTPDFYDYDRKNLDLSVVNNLDNGTLAAKGVITKARIDYSATRPKIPWERTVIYELHPKGISQANLAIPAITRGKLSAIKHPQLISHFRKLGVNCLELMPIQAFCSEQALLDAGKTNYWGYNPLSFMAIHPAYCEVEPEIELQKLVNELHYNGIEIILDIVFNHSAETDQYGPTYSWRGIANGEYYMLKDDQQGYHDFSGTGNVFNASNPRVVELMISALEHWASFGIDGFRFDLGSLLAIDSQGKFDREHLFFKAIAASEHLKDLKMIAEPWDLNNYALGQFPAHWAEFNDRFRDNIKSSLINHNHSRSDLAHLLAGTTSYFSYLKAEAHRPINYITNHDGFSLNDLVSFKLPRGESSADFSKAHLNVNYGVEGLVGDSQINAARLKHLKNFMLLMFISQGVPFIRSSDEFLQSLDGEANSYAIDSEQTWFNWDMSKRGQEFFDFLAKLIDFRKKNSQFFQLYNEETEYRTIKWYKVDGTIMQNEDWEAHSPIGLLLELSHKVIYCLINIGDSSFQINLPLLENYVNWKIEFCSSLSKDALQPNSIQIWEAPSKA